MVLTVTRSVLDGLVAEAARAWPEECCGILLGNEATIDDTRAAANVADDRCRRFEIDPQALVDVHRAARGGGPRVLGYFHSHPHGPAEPSPVDRAQAAHDGSIWAIIGKTAVTFWRDDESGFTALSYTVEER